MERLNLNLLRSLAVLLEQRNVTHAAEQLHLTQSAMSRQLAQLRDYFNDPLLVREGNDYLLTALAQRLKPRLQSIIAQLDGLRDDSQFNPLQCQRSFTFASTDYVANFIFPDVITHLCSQAPGINLEYRIWQTDWLNSLGSLPIDFTTTMVSEVPDNLYGIHLGSDEPVLLMGSLHPLLRQETLTLNDLLAYPYVRISSGGDKDSFFDHHLRQQGHKRRINYEVPFYTSAFNVISRTSLLLIVPRHIAFNASRVHAVSWREMPIDGRPTHDYYLLWHSIHHHDPAHRWTRELIAGIVRDSIFSPRHARDS